MTRSTDPASVVGAVLLLTTAFLLVAAPLSVLLGGDQLGAVVIAVSGVGFAVLHLAVVLAVHGRALAAADGGGRQ